MLERLKKCDRTIGMAIKLMSSFNFLSYALNSTECNHYHKEKNKQFDNITGWSKFYIHVCVIRRTH